jgi:hypothetical protein
MWKRIVAIGVITVVGLALLTGSLYVAFRPNVALAQDELDHVCSGACLAGEGQAYGCRGNGGAGCSGECLEGNGEHVCSGECLSDGECDGECLNEQTQEQLRLRDGSGCGQALGRGTMMRGRLTQ